MANQKKSTAVAIILSFFVSGLGLLYIDAGKYWKKFLVSIILSLVVVGWFLGMYWTATAPELK